MLIFLTFILLSYHLHEGNFFTCLLLCMWLLH